MYENFLKRFCIHSVESLFFPLSGATLFFVFAESMRPGFVTYFFDMRYLVALTLLINFLWVGISRNVLRYFVISK